MKLTRRGFLAGAGAVAVGSAAWGLDPNRAWADEEAAEEAAGTGQKASPRQFHGRTSPSHRPASC